MSLRYDDQTLGTSARTKYLCILVSQSVANKLDSFNIGWDRLPSLVKDLETIRSSK